MDAAFLQSLALETLQQRLTEALEARHQLAVGRREAEVTVSGGQRARFTEAKAAELDDYIAAIHAAISAKQSSRPLRGPIYLGFSG